MSRIVVFFHSSKCGHSRRMDSIVEHFMRIHRGHVRLAKVEINERKDLADRFGVTSSPTLLLLDDLREVARLEGRATLPDMRVTFDEFIGNEQLVASDLAAAAG